MILIHPIGVQLPSGVAYEPSCHRKMIVFSGIKHLLSNVTHDPISGKASIVMLPFIVARICVTLTRYSEVKSSERNLTFLLSMCP